MTVKVIIIIARMGKSAEFTVVRADLSTRFGALYIKVLRDINVRAKVKEGKCQLLTK
ncbi:MAG: hypothetical protein V3R96_04545 [Dehalococcoidales bacterium]